MKITIKGMDYTSTLDAARPLTIERKLNEPSVSQLWLSLPINGSLSTPSRNQSIAITGDDGTHYFTGYIAASPMPECAGEGLEGPHYRIAIQALSDELLLDQLPMAPSTGSSGETAGVLMSALVTRTGATTLSTQGLTLGSAVSNFVMSPGATWSQSAGQVASQSRAAYRAVNGVLTLTPILDTVHTLNEIDGSLNLSNLALTASIKRALANDITVCGQLEPVACVTEYFQGDGITTQFYLSEKPYFPSSSKSKIIRELFNESQIDERVWCNPSGNGYMRLGQGGLVMDGGNWTDGQTCLTWIDQVEMGGTLLLEAVGVSLSPGSTGILSGFFAGAETLVDCTAGFQVTSEQGSGEVTLQPVIQGTPSGLTYAISTGSQYTLRIRVHCAENERAQAIYRSYGDSGPITYGGQWNIAPGKVQMEIQDSTNGVSGMPVTLYDGSVASLPGACTVAACSSINLIGTMRALNLENLGSGWVVSTPPVGGPYARRIGSTAQAGECYLDNTGKVVFYTGFVPQAGEQVAVSYRTVGRAIGRAVNTTSQLALAQQQLPSVAAWLGTVTNPQARSSADCRNAALVIAEAAASVSALWSGTYKGSRTSFATDVWPGDSLLLNAPSSNLNVQVVVRSVKVSYRASQPDMVTYAIAFANDWADDLAIETSATVPADAWLLAPIAPAVLGNLGGLTVTTLNGSTLAVNTGVMPPDGGGFEVRIRDFAFMPGTDPDLVMRTSQQNMSFLRKSANERYYIRMYDGSTPPNYSEFSTALFVNLPLGV